MVLAIDIGGTKTLLAVFDKKGKVVDSIKIPTSKDFKQFTNDLADIAEKFTTYSIKQGCAASRGLIDRKTGVFLEDTVLEWRNAPLVSTLGQLFGCDFILENDSKLAGLSEASVLGQYRKVLYITISTGIGTALVIDGKIDKDLENSEIGKSLYWYDGELTPWEQFASGKAINERFGRQASEIDDEDSWRGICLDWAPGIINACLALNPDVIVVGGSLGSHFHKYGQLLNETVQSLSPEGFTPVEIRQAHRPEDAVIYGCYEYAKSR